MNVLHPKRLFGSMFTQNGGTPSFNNSIKAKDVYILGFFRKSTLPGGVHDKHV